MGAIFKSPIVVINSEVIEVGGNAICNRVIGVTRPFLFAIIFDSHETYVIIRCEVYRSHRTMYSISLGWTCRCWVILFFVHEFTIVKFSRVPGFSSKVSGQSYCVHGVSF